MNWGTATLDQFSTFGAQYGANAGAIARSGTRPRYVRITDVNSQGRLVEDGAVEADLEDESEFLLYDGDLLFARSGNTVGKTYRYSKAEGPCVFAGYMIRFRLRPELVDSRFAFYFTRSPQYLRWVSSKKRVAGQPNINGSEYSALALPLPAPREQGRIVELLDQADVLRRQRAEADQFAVRILPALFHKLFGDPTTNPKRWPREKLGVMLDAIDSGWSPVCENRPAQAQEWGILKLGSVTTNRYLDCENKALPVDESPQPELEVKSGDLLFSRKNTRELVGACAYVKTTRPKLMLSDLVFRLRLKTDAGIHPLYLWALLTNQGKRHAIEMLASGSAGSMPNISKGRLEMLDVEKPPKPLQDQFANSVTALDLLRDQMDTADVKLESLFSVLLHRAFTGELTARWREAHLKELLAEMEQQARLLSIQHNKELIPC